MNHSSLFASAWNLLEALSVDETLQLFIYFVEFGKGYIADLLLTQQMQEMLVPPTRPSLHFPIIPVGFARKIYQPLNFPPWT